MAIKDLVSGAWQDIGALKVPVSGAYQTADHANALVSGAWQTVWNSAVYFIRDGVRMSDTTRITSSGSVTYNYDGRVYINDEYNSSKAAQIFLYVDTSTASGKTLYMKIWGVFYAGSGARLSCYAGTLSSVDGTWNSSESMLSFTIPSGLTDTELVVTLPLVDSDTYIYDVYIA